MTDLPKVAELPHIAVMTSMVTLVKMALITITLFYYLTILTSLKDMLD